MIFIDSSSLRQLAELCWRNIFELWKAPCDGLCFGFVSFGELLMRNDRVGLRLWTSSDWGIRLVWCNRLGLHLIRDGNRQRVRQFVAREFVDFTAISITVWRKKLPRLIRRPKGIENKSNRRRLTVNHPQCLATKLQFANKVAKLCRLTWCNTILTARSVNRRARLSTIPQTMSSEILNRIGSYSKFDLELHSHMLFHSSCRWINKALRYQFPSSCITLCDSRTIKSLEWKIFHDTVSSHALGVDSTQVCQLDHPVSTRETCLATTHYRSNAN